MSSVEPETTIAKNIRVIEWLKTELAASLVAVYRALLKGSEEAIIDGLAGLIMVSYVLGRRLGVSFAKIDLKVQARIRTLIDENHEVEKWYGDLSSLLQFLEAKKR
ncbi:MAG: MazG-like family protein [Firmicutes bacterium]|nr:MazG-like family protein [Bacillota bacterium]